MSGEPLLQPPPDAELNQRIAEAHDFLTALWPTDVDGVLTLCVREQGGEFRKYEEYQVTREQLERASRAAVRQSFWGDVWVGVNLKREATYNRHRGKANEIVGMPGLWLDVDYGRVGHANPLTPPDEEAATQIITACEIKPGLVVHSGFGLQPYWLVTEPWLGDSDEWRTGVQLTEERLFTLAQDEASRFGWSLDRVTDLPRVLRVPGTLNWKTPEAPAPVQLRVVDRATRYERGELTDWLATRMPLAERVSHNGGGGSAGGGGGDGGVGGGQVADEAYGPAPLGPVMAGCAWVRHGYEDAATLPEPEWKALLTILGRCEDGDQLAQVWSSSHPTYSPEATERALKHARENLGPRGCAWVERETAGRFCATCPERGQITGPLVLGRRAERRVEPPAGVEDDTVAVVAHEEAGYQLTDHGNARRFIDRYGPELRAVPDGSGAWYVWDGVRWLADERGFHAYRARRAVLHIYDEVAEAEATRRGELADWARRSQTVGRIEAVTRLARTDPAIAVTRADFDTDDWLLNCLNGTLDLRTGELRAHRREDLMTRVTPVTYDAGASCDAWEAYLRRVQPDEEVRDYLRRMVGYTLTGSVDEKCFFMLWGTGHNGKTLFVETLAWLLGGYGTAALKSLFVERRADAHPVDLAMIMGARFITCGEELVAGERLADGTIKGITGGDTMSARRMRENSFTFQPRAKIWLATNHKPRLTDVGQAMADRLRVIPWLERIGRAEEVPKTEMHRRLRAEGAGILAWAVRGCLEWQATGVGTGGTSEGGEGDGGGLPAVVKAAGDEYLDDEDVFRHFAEECLESVPETERIWLAEGERAVWVSAAGLMKIYLWWWEKDGNDPRYALSKRRIGDEMKRLGYQPKKVSNVRGWFVRVKSAPSHLLGEGASYPSL